MAYEFTPQMDEISGFGGGYEACCRKMLKAGLEWCDTHPEADLRFKHFEDVYGLLIDDTDDAKALSTVVADSVKNDGGCTGAMHQAVITHIMVIRANGWDWYVAEMTKPHIDQEKQEEARS
ncbi:MAG: hypothetical protein ACYCOR_10715 [Acidobacteriaceae bacterium]